jgi:hypothetical protein
MSQSKTSSNTHMEGVHSENPVKYIWTHTLYRAAPDGHTHCIVLPLSFFLETRAPPSRPVGVACDSREPPVPATNVALSERPSPLVSALTLKKNVTWLSLRCVAVSHQAWWEEVTVRPSSSIDGESNTKSSQSLDACSACTRVVFLSSCSFLPPPPPTPKKSIFLPWACQWPVGFLTLFFYQFLTTPSRCLRFLRSCGCPALSMEQKARISVCYWLAQAPYTFP